jgi:uncharacterized protein (DUF1330 family)
MSAYMILNYDVTDAEALASYREVATPMLFGPGLGEVVAAADMSVPLPEGGPVGTHTVILRFADVDHARSVYGSQSYQAVIGERLAATQPRFAMIIPGL